jgi:gluconate 2-dehydrogenase gamma chain
MEELRHRSLAATQAATLRAVLARLIPADEHGPGAVEAGVLSFLDSELAGALRGRRGRYAAGLDALGPDFAELDPAEQDAILRRAEAGELGAELRAWFELVLGDCIDGYLSDPAYGGNRGSAGWKVVGYPGPALVWREEEQQLDAVVPARGSTVLTLRETVRR